MITGRNNPKISDMRDCYKHLFLEEGPIDCIYLVDGGCDVLLTGKEEGLGTPVEDMMHLRVILDLDIKEKYIMAIGVDIDIADDVKLEDLENRLHELESYKLLEFKLSPDMDSVIKYCNIFEQCQPINSIVQSLIIACIQGHTGYYTPPHLVPRIGLNKIYLNPRICTAYVYNLHHIAHDVIYLGDIKDEMDTDDVEVLIINYN